MKEYALRTFSGDAYSPKKGVDWSLSWQETEQDALGTLIPKIRRDLESG